MQFITESSSIYDIDEENMKIRRISASNKRGDGDWLTLYGLPTLRVGYPVVLILEQLSKYGPDDYGNENSKDEHTVRVTSPVRKIF